MITICKFFSSSLVTKSSTGIANPNQELSHIVVCMNALNNILCGMEEFVPPEQKKGEKAIDPNFNGVIICNAYIQFLNALLTSVEVCPKLIKRINDTLTSYLNKLLVAFPQGAPLSDACAMLPEAIKMIFVLAISSCKFHLIFFVFVVDSEKVDKLFSAFNKVIPDQLQAEIKRNLESFTLEVKATYEDLDHVLINSSQATLAVGFLDLTNIEDKPLIATLLNLYLSINPNNLYNFSPTLIVKLAKLAICRSYKNNDSRIYFSHIKDRLYNLCCGRCLFPFAQNPNKITAFGTMIADPLFVQNGWLGAINVLKSKFSDSQWIEVLKIDTASNLIIFYEKMGFSSQLSASFAELTNKVQLLYLQYKYLLQITNQLAVLPLQNPAKE